MIIAFLFVFILLFSFLLAFFSMRDFEPFLTKFPPGFLRRVHFGKKSLYGVIVFMGRGIFHYIGKASFLRGEKEKPGVYSSSDSEGNSD